MDNNTFGNNKNENSNEQQTSWAADQTRAENKEQSTAKYSTVTQEPLQKESKAIVDVQYDEVRHLSMQQNSYYNETIKDKQQDKHKQTSKKGGKVKFLTGLVVASMVGGSFAGAGFALVMPYANQLYKDQTNQGEADSEHTPLNIAEQEMPMDQQRYVQQTNYQPITGEYNNPVPVIAEQVGPSVVSIINTRIIDTWGSQYSESGLGSGVIFQIDQENVYIVSNAHVVEGASTLVVTFLGDYKVAGEIVGYDTPTDIAVVSVKLADIPQEIRAEIKPAPIGDSDALRVGDMAIAIGTPIDEAYNNTVTVGYISALNREIDLTDQTLNLIQTDAAINPGNSGGALVGPTGEVIGINTVKLAHDEIEGMGFALPINDVKPIIDELMTYGRIVRPSLGIMGTNLEESINSLFDIAVGIGVYQTMPGSSADIAGIKAGDIITHFDGVRTETIEELQELLKEKQVGDTVTVIIVRQDEKYEVSVKLQELPQN